MDDARTREALDSLAELYLTGLDTQDAQETSDKRDVDGAVRPVRRPPSVATARPARAPSVAPASTDQPNAADPADAGLDGPEPFRFSPRPPASTTSNDPPPTPGADRPPSDPLRAITGHDDSSTSTAESPFLGLRQNTPDTEPPQEPASSDSAPAVHVEAVLVGNLPSISGPWLTQYAQLVADAEGPVAILHLGEREVELELVEPRHAPDTAQRGWRLSGGSRLRHPLIDLLDSAVRAERHAVRTLMIHVVDGLAGRGAHRLLAIDHWTLLSGADEAAVHAAAQALDAVVRTNPAVSRKRLALMVAGADEAASQDVANQLRSATGKLLDEPLELLGWLPRMGPVRVRQLGVFGGIETLWPQLTEWMALLETPPLEHVESTREEPAQATPEQPSVESPPRRQEREAGVATRSRVVAASPGPARDTRSREPHRQRAARSHWPRPEPPERSAASAPRPSDESSAEPRPSSTPPRRAAVGVPPARRATEPEPEPRREALTDSGVPDLAALATASEGVLAGGVRLDARCPHQPGIALVLDQDGGIHLLARAETHGNGDAAADLTAFRTAVVDLLDARQWVRQHLDLLRLTQRQCRFDPDATPVLHLFTTRADLAVPLVSRLGETLRLHLLRRVEPTAEPTWLTAALS